MPTFTQKFEDFLDNNHPGGYMSTSINISDSDLDARISQNINNRGFLTSTSHLPWNQIDNKPTLFSGSYNDLSNKPTLFSGNYNDLNNKPTIPTISISNTLNSGTKIATITINGTSTDLYVDNSNSGGQGGSVAAETDPYFSNSPAANISITDIFNWNNNITNISSLNDDVLDMSATLLQKKELMYIDIASSPYNLSNFGINNFIIENDVLFDTLFDNYTSKDIVIQTNNGNFNLTSLNMSDDYDFAIFEKKSTNYLDIINYIVQEPDESSSSYENRLTQYLYDNINDYFYKVYYIRDGIKNKTYCINKIGIYVDMNRLEQILDSGD